MRTVTNEAYDDLALKFGMVSLELLNDALKKNGISSKKTREKICGSVYFGMSSFLESCWIQHGKRRYRPVLAFAEHKGSDIPAKQVLLQDPDEGMSFHEVAHFEAEAFFKSRKEDTSDIKTGQIRDQS